MNSLAFSQSPPYLAKPSPWKPVVAPTIHPGNMKNLNRKPPKWKLQANSRGFGSTRLTQNRPEESGNTKTLNKNKNNNNNNDDDDEIPEEVFNRILVRIMVSVGAPLALGLGSVQLFGVAKKQLMWDVPLWLTYLTLLLTFGASILGIAYGSLSTSLDPNKKGSFLGFEEARHNWAEMWKEEDEGRK